MRELGVALAGGPGCRVLLKELFVVGFEPQGKLEICKRDESFGYIGRWKRTNLI